MRRVRRIFGLRAVGHTGTLDPFASGLMVVLLGRATRLARFVEAASKTYLATARLGVRTDTDDATGTPIGGADGGHGAADGEAVAVDESRVRAALAALSGPQRQRPPAYSAKHVAGTRSYRLARAGKRVELRETAVTVHRIELVEWHRDAVTFRTVVSAGTYVRALARDLGDALGVGAHLSELRREAIGRLRVEEAVPLDALTRETLPVPLRHVLSDLPAVELDDAARAGVRHGRAVPMPADRAAAGQNTIVAGASPAVLLVADGEVVAVAREEGGWLRPSVVLEDA